MEHCEDLAANENHANRYLNSRPTFRAFHDYGFYIREQVVSIFIEIMIVQGTFSQYQLA